MSTRDDDDPRAEWRRRALLRWLAQRGAALAALAGSARAAAQVFGNAPRRLVNESVFRVSGDTSVNGQPVTRATRIGAGDLLRTGRDSELVFVVGSAAMLMRADTQVQLQGASASGQPTTVVVPSGKLLAVFAPGQRAVQTATAVVRISGTGVYVESNPQETYFCTCYGKAEVVATADTTSREQVISRHHDKPLYIAAGQAAGRAIRRAPFINHTDDELALIEALVGRAPPWALGVDRYDRRRPADEYNR
ncbi:MAG TPA: hypothetical protein VFQ20_05315 [Burkholderiaceae bacterium]|nr:hypothetical protein [Burkholderiaceae bacterium]